MIPTIGRIVIYRLTEENALQINRRRATSGSIALMISEGAWPLGAQAHIGNEVKAGQEFPMLIVHVAEAVTAIRGQVFLDGNDVLWVQAENGFEDGTWHWPGDVNRLDCGSPAGMPQRRSNCF